MITRRTFFALLVPIPAPTLQARINRLARTQRDAAHELRAIIAEIAQR